jgi:NADH-quinone oxidoreductase subunit H
MAEAGYAFIDIAVLLVKIALVLGVNLLLLALMTLAERRVAGFMQDRYGPNRVGPEGLFQPIADGVKFLFKEDVIPSHVEKVLYILAPSLVLAPALLTFAVIPFGGTLSAFGREIQLQIANLNVGLLYIFALASLTVYGLVLGGWASNSKYPLLGGLRSSAQMISYEISMGLSVIGVLMIAGSLRLNDVVAQQNTLLFGVLPNWNVFLQPLGFLIFLIAAFAETNRLPFDLPEAEPELVGGYHTEYSSMKFAMFFMGEYVALITSSALITTLYFGGWDFPYVDESALGVWGVVLSVLAFSVKTGFFLFLYLWVRWTLPRFRFDQLMNLGWKVMLPLALLNVVLTGIVMYWVV